MAGELFTVEVVGREQLVLRLKGQLDNVRGVVRRETALLTEQLRGLVKSKITGGPLYGKADGPLAQSIKADLVETPDSITGRVFSDGSVPYARIQEYGGVTRAHVILPRNALALAFMGRGGGIVFARRVNHPGSRMPERSYARSSLDDMRGEIVDRLRGAVQQTLRAS